MHGELATQHLFETAVKNAAAIGRCEAFEMVLGLDYNQVMSEVFDGGE